MIALGSAALLLAAALAVWFVAAGARAAARLQIRFAAILFAAAALAAAGLPAAAATVTLLVLPIALAVLALAVAAGFARPLPAGPAALLLGLISLAGLAAALTGLAALALAPAAAAIAALALLFLRRFEAAPAASRQGLLAAFSFLAGASAFARDGAGAGFLLFAAAGLLGATLALARSDVAVKERPARDLRAAFAVRGRR